MNRKLKNEELERKSVEAYKQANKMPIVIVLDNIRSLNNIGSVFRTSDAFLVEKIYLCGITAQPPNKDIQKTALGATDSVDWEYYQSTLEALNKIKSEGYRLVGIEQTEKSTMLDKFQVNSQDKIALVLGNEVKGIEQAVINECDLCVEIPQVGTKHSLNISVAAGITIWDVYTKLKA